MDPIALRRAVETERKRRKRVAEDRERDRADLELGRLLAVVGDPGTVSSTTRWIEWDAFEYSQAEGASDHRRADGLLAALWCALARGLCELGLAEDWASVSNDEARSFSSLEQLDRNGMDAGAVVDVGAGILQVLLRKPREDPSATREQVMNTFATLRDQAPAVLRCLGLVPAAFRAALRSRDTRDAPRRLGDRIFVTRRRVAELMKTTEDAFRKRIKKESATWPATAKVRPGRSTRKRAGWWLDEIESLGLFNPSEIGQLRDSPGYDK